MTDDRAEFTANRDAGLVKRHEQRLARAREGIEFPADGIERTAYLEGEPVTDMVIPPEAVEAGAQAACELAYPPKTHQSWADIDCWEQDAWRATATAALEAALPHLRPMPVTSREPEGDALKAIEKWYADMHGEDSPMFNFSSGRLSAPDDESDLKSLVETATRLGRELGRREAAEEAAVRAEVGMHAKCASGHYAICGVCHALKKVAQAAREIATKEPK